MSACVYVRRFTAFLHIYLIQSLSHRNVISFLHYIQYKRFLKSLCFLVFRLLKDAPFSFPLDVHFKFSIHGKEIFPFSFSFLHQAKYKGASKADLSNSLYKQMPATIDSVFAREVTQLQSEVSASKIVTSCR